MIKAEELRIGNLVNYRIHDDLDERKSWVEVNEVEASDLVILQSGLDYDYQPIPLTEEWLVDKFGGVPKVVNTKKRMIRLVELHGLKFEISNSGNVYYYQQNKIINYVHKLQNLVYELRNVKLKIKESCKD